MEQKQDVKVEEIKMTDEEIQEIINNNKQHADLTPTWFMSNLKVGEYVYLAEEVVRLRNENRHLQRQISLLEDAYEYQREKAKNAPENGTIT